jgi:hypothetical protein
MGTTIKLNSRHQRNTLYLWRDPLAEGWSVIRGPADIYMVRLLSRTWKINDVNDCKSSIAPTAYHRYIASYRCNHGHKMDTHWDCQTRFFLQGARCAHCYYVATQSILNYHAGIIQEIGETGVAMSTGVRIHGIHVPTSSP